MRGLLTLGTQQENAPVEDGVLVDIHVWVGTLNITLVVQCLGGRYYGSIRTPSREAYSWVLDAGTRDGDCGM
jgi:hypothetical protein